MNYLSDPFINLFTYLFKDNSNFYDFGWRIGGYEISKMRLVRGEMSTGRVPQPLLAF